MSNSNGERLRRAAAEAAVSDMISWFNKCDGQVAVLDATNSTKSRRRWIYNSCRAAGIEPLFVESICSDTDLIMNNIREVKTTSPDYKGQDPEVAARDFMNRIQNYEKAYETIDSDENYFAYVKLIDVGAQVIINQIKDYLSSRLVYYIQNLHIRPRSIWLSRVSFFHLSMSFYTNDNSTANPTTTSSAKSEATPASPRVEKNTQRPSQISSGNPDFPKTRKSPSGPPR